MQSLGVLSWTFPSGSIAHMAPVTVPLALWTPPPPDAWLPWIELAPLSVLQVDPDVVQRSPFRR
jgi:hypothetical protein